MSYSNMFGKEIEKAFNNECNLDFERPINLEAKEHNISVVDQEILFSLLKNQDVITQALQDPDILSNVIDTLRDMNTQAEMDASMIVDKKEEETVSEETESTEELSTSVTPTSRVGSSTPDTSFNKTSSTDDILSMCEATNETTSIDSDTMIISKVKSEDLYTVADLDNELNEILHNDICKEKLTEKQIKWIKDGKNVLVSSFNSLKDLERFSANFNKTLKTSSYNKNNISNLRPFRKEDIDVIRIMYVMDQPEDILDKYNIFFNDPPSFVAMYYKLDAFIRYVKKNFK